MKIVDVVIVGAGGQGMVVADILMAARAAGDAMRAVAFVDDDPERHDARVLGLPVAGARGALAAIPHDAVVVAIGDNRQRRRITEELLRGGERVVTVRHPSAWLASETSVGEGSMISAGAVVLPGATLARGVLLNTKASVDHESRIGEFAHVAAGATVGANVSIGEEVFLAMSSTVVSGRSVGARTVVGAGAVVIRDLPSDVRAWGVPARVV